MEKIAFGNDHALSQEQKNQIIEHVQQLGYEVINLGSDNQESLAYSLSGINVGEMVANGEAKFGIIICGTGVGISIAANKVPGIRAALVGKIENAQLAREHNDANIIAFGIRDMSISDIKKSIDLFLNSNFEGGRHIDRLQVIRKFEKLC